MYVSYLQLSISFPPLKQKDISFSLFLTEVTNYSYNLLPCVVSPLLPSFGLPLGCNLQTSLQIINIGVLFEQPFV